MSNSVAKMPDRWDKMRLGDRDAMLVLYEYYYNDLLSYGVQLSNSIDTAKDAINDVFLHLWEHHTNLKPVKNVKAYLFACVRRKIFHPVYFNNKVLLAEEVAFKNMDYREIGLTTGMSLKTAYNTIYNAVKVLTNELRDTLLCAYLLLFI